MKKAQKEEIEVKRIEAEIKKYCDLLKPKIEELKKEIEKGKIDISFNKTSTIPLYIPFSLREAYTTLKNMLIFRKMSDYDKISLEVKRKYEDCLEEAFNVLEKYFSLYQKKAFSNENKDEIFLAQFLLNSLDIIEKDIPLEICPHYDLDLSKQDEVYSKYLEWLKKLEGMGFI